MSIAKVKWNMLTIISYLNLFNLLERDSLLGARVTECCCYNGKPKFNVFAITAPGDLWHFITQETFYPFFIHDPGNNSKNIHNVIILHNKIANNMTKSEPLWQKILSAHNLIRNSKQIKISVYNLLGSAVKF